LAISEEKAKHKGPPQYKLIWISHQFAKM